MTAQDLTRRRYEHFFDERPLGLIEVGKRRQLTGLHIRGNLLADLERDDLITLPSGKTMATIRLTEVGKQAIRVIPDDVRADWFPLPGAIAQAKARLR